MTERRNRSGWLVDEQGRLFCPGCRQHFRLGESQHYNMPDRSVWHRECWEAQLQPALTLEFSR